MIDVGKIVAAHGIKGEVKVMSFSTNPHRFDKNSIMQLEKTKEWVKVVSVRPQNDVLIIVFDKITDRNEAEALRGSMLQIDEKEAAPLPDDEFYFFQIEGAEVFDEGGKKLGTLTALLESGANDVYRVDMENGNYLLLPALKQVVQEVNLEEKTMRVSLLPGLMEACLYHED